MILHKLADYYDRIAADPATADVLPKPGYSLQQISFCVVLRPDGTLHAFQSVTDGDAKRPRPQKLLVPGQSHPPGTALTPRFLWDSSAYMLGYAIDDPDEPRTRDKFASYRAYHLGVRDRVEDPAFVAIGRFLEQWSPDKAKEHAPDLDRVAGNFGVFKIAGEAQYVHQKPAVISFWADRSAVVDSDEKPRIGMCLVTGKEEPLARKHEPQIKGVAGAQAAGALLVSYNASAYESYGKDKGENGHVGVAATFKYTNALNYLLGRRDRRTGLGDATFIYWADRPTPLEDYFDAAFGDTPPPKADAPAEDKQKAAQVKSFLEQLRDGHAAADAFDANNDTGFYVLGLSPNASRLSVRLWLQSTVGEMSGRLRQFMDDLEIVGLDPAYPVTIRRMVNATAQIINDKPDYDSVSPRMAGDLTRSVLNGGRFGNELGTAILIRIRADARITPIRAAVLKAFVIRNGNIPMDPYLNKTHPEPAYHCGRLLAVLAFAQEEALGQVNAGVIRRSLGSVMATPGLQVGRLQRAAEVGHIPKLKRDLPEFVRDELKHINGALKSEVPLHLTPLEQSVFMLGFYQQLQFLDFISVQVSGGKRVRTTQGEWVRSKGEKQVAELLTKHGVRYAFEPSASLPSGPDRWPDFVVSATEKSKTIFIEYLGMDTPEYNARWDEKVKAYAEGKITEEGGDNGRLVIIDARENRLDDIAILHILAPSLGLSADKASPVEGDD